MAKTNWKYTDTVKPEDMNSLGQEINDLQQNTKLASLTKPGIVQLSSATNSTAEDRAATPKAVKTAEDNAKAYTDGKLDRVDLTTTLGPGTSVINVDQASGAEFRVYGNTLVNLLGSYGNFEIDSNGDGVADGWSKPSGGTRGTCSLETSGVKHGLKAQRITSAESDTTPYRYVYRRITAPKSGSYHVMIADAAVDGGRAWIRVFKNNEEAVNHIISSSYSSVDTVLFAKFVVPSDAIELSILVYNSIDTGVVGWTQYDGVGLYEVSEELYNRIGVDITADNIRDYLPHVDGVQHVQGASVYHPSKNLLPSEFSTLHVNARMTAPYELTLNATVTDQFSYLGYIPALPLTKYVYTAEQSGTNGVTIFCTLQQYDRDLRLLNSPNTTNGSLAFTTVAGTAFIRIVFYSKGAGTFVLKNWQLELGDKATDSEPAKPQHLIIPEVLAEVGGYRDEVRIRLDKAELIRHVERDVKLDGSREWTSSGDNLTHYSGFMRISTPIDNRIPNIARGTKYTGKALKSTGKLLGVDYYEADLINCYTATSQAGITVANSESGWIQTLNPTPNAIKALMNGWKATNNDGTKYTSWVSIIDGKPPVTNTESYVAANKAHGWTAWATMDYALAIPEIKPIKTEGTISLHSGGNQLTVETGFIQREKAVLHFSTGTNKYYINSNTPGTQLSRRPRRILSIYKESFFDNRSWSILVNNTNNNSWAEAVPENVDLSKNYYVTYITADKYDYTANVNQLDVSYKAGINAALSDAVSNISELKAQNDRQDFADDYIQAHAEDTRRDLESLISEKIDRTDISQPLLPRVTIVSTDQPSMTNFVIHGRTEFNQVKNGSFEVDSNNDGLADSWTKSQAGVFTLVSTNALYGVKSQRITSSADDTGSTRYAMQSGLSVVAGKKYVIIADAVTDGTGVAKMAVYRDGTTASNYVAETSQSNSSKVHFIKYSPSTDTNDLRVLIYNSVSKGIVGWVQWDGVGIYELSEELYKRIGVDINETNIREYVPHVDDMQYVDGVVVTKRSKNLLPGQPDTIHANAKVTTPYELLLNATEKYQASLVTVNVKPNTLYTLKASMEASAGQAYLGYRNLFADGTNQYLGELNSGSGRYVTTFTTPPNCTRLSLAFGSSVAGTFTFKNWQLELGDRATDFEIAGPQQLIIPKILAEVEGIKDEVRVGQTESTLIRRVVTGVHIDGTYPTQLNGDDTGKTYRQLYIPLTKLPGAKPNTTELSGVRYDGKRLTSMSLVKFSAGDQISTGSNGLAMSVNNMDSGWNSSLKPGANAIKALANGWKANGNNGSVYNSWVSILNGKAPASNTEAYVSANKAPGWDSWATINYVLSVPEIEPIKTEGSISLSPENNQMEIESGVVQREKVKIQISANKAMYFINSQTQGTQPTRRPGRILTVYKDDKPDHSWIVMNSGSNNGTQYAQAPAEKVDPNANYYITYLPKDREQYSTNPLYMIIQYKSGLSATLTNVVDDVVELKAQNDRQDFADTYIQAYTENNRKDIGTLTDLQTTNKTSLVAAINETFTIGNERKREVVDALIALGVTASTKDSWDELISKMAKVIKATGNVTAGDVLAGKTFSNAGKNGLTGTMPNQGAKIITPNTANQIIASGYHNGNGYVKGDPNLVAGNLPKDVSIFGITGLLERLTTADRNAIISAIVAKGVAASAADSNSILAQKIGQISIKQASGNTEGKSIEINNLDFSPIVVMINYGGGFEYYDSGWDSKYMNVSGDACFIKGVNRSPELYSSTTTGRDGTSNLRVSTSITWSPNGFTVSLRSNISQSYYESLYIRNWYAFGL
ncbi:phage tail protein [Paenibacillus aceti]|uniref:Uncharacterized protein n=1 Tax=Paenibacillus aceti TaxID=1820010 RepID=A0ABQ1W589_9BACL|nr:phage tail protein [Paenibacillus aceti]GGG13581.1 hypothetical protein GCM10010913_39220 [Paenibacillus aceti]